MNQLTPADFRDRLDAAMPGAAADGALNPIVEADMLAGVRLLRRRRGAAVLGAAAAVALLASGIGLANGLGDRSSSGTDAATLPRGDAALLDACRSGNTSDAGRDAIFGSGTPSVRAEARSEQRVVLAVESADGSHWGECFVSLVESEFTSGMEVYDATGRTEDSRYTVGFPGCAEQERCTQFSVSVVDRRVPAVAAVEFLTVDGETTRVETVGGYYAFSYLGDLPAELEVTQVDPVSPLKRITFFDASGTPIAAEAQDGSGTGEDGETVGDLPSIREFPSLRAAQGF